MLQIYDVTLQTVRELRPAIETIERRDADLGRQMRRAACSVALNVAEGAYSQGRNRQSRYYSALGSARETLACVEVAEALGYVAGVDDGLRKRFDQIVGTLVRLAS